MTVMVAARSAYPQDFQSNLHLSLPGPKSRRWSRKAFRHAVSAFWRFCLTKKFGPNGMANGFMDHLRFWAGWTQMQCCFICIFLSVRWQCGGVLAHVAMHVRSRAYSTRNFSESSKRVYVVLLACTRTASDLCICHWAYACILYRRRYYAYMRVCVCKLYIYIHIYIYIYIYIYINTHMLHENSRKETLKHTYMNDTLSWKQLSRLTGGSLLSEADVKFGDLLALELPAFSTLSSCMCATYLCIHTCMYVHTHKKKM